MEPVSINGIEIPTDLIAMECQHHPAANADAAQQEATRALAVRELLLQEASRLDIVAAPQIDPSGRTESTEEAQIRKLLEDQIDTPRAEDATCRRYYDNNIERFRSADIFEASHILLSADPADVEAYARAVTDAEAIIAWLQEHPDQFAGLARQRSACSSAPSGGQLGQITRGQTTPEFETFLFALAEGQLCPQPVKTHYGVHVLRLDRRHAGQTMPFETVRDLIADYIEEASWRRAVAQYIRRLAGQATVRGIDLGGTASSLVQ